jgi:hypothetical protein
MRLIINGKSSTHGYEHLENKHEKHYTHEEKHHEEDEHQSVGICQKSRYWEDAAYHDYVRKHGEHFSRSLSVWVCSMMENRNGKTHTWSPEQVDMAITGVGKMLKPAHKYDAHYLANMAYADYMGKSLKEDADCLQWVVDFLEDPDGYAEKAFNHWISDAMKKCLEVDWRAFI